MATPPASERERTEAMIRQAFKSTFGVDPDDFDSVREIQGDIQWLRERRATEARRREQQAKMLNTVLAGAALSLLAGIANLLGLKIPAGIGQ